MKLTLVLEKSYTFVVSFYILHSKHFVYGDVTFEKYGKESLYEWCLGKPFNPVLYHFLELSVFTLPKNRFL